MTAAPDSEIRTLLSFPHGQSRHVLGILDADALRQPLLPSGRTCLGLVQHLALDVDQFWFRAVVVSGEEDVPQVSGLWRRRMAGGPDAPAAAILD